MRKLNTILTSALTLSFLTMPLYAYAYDTPYKAVFEPFEDTYTVETEQFTYRPSGDYQAGQYGMQLETDLTDANYMITGVFYTESSDPLFSCLYTISPINMEYQTRGFVYAYWFTPFLEEGQILQVGDLLRIENIIEIDTGVIEYEVHNSSCEYLGHGTDILGEDFVKVIRHEWIKDFNEYTSEDFSNMTFIQGDATEDEDVNIVDVIAVNKNILGKETFSAYAQYVSDVNQNGTVDSGDSLEILKYIVGLNESL